MTGVRLSDERLKKIYKELLILENCPNCQMY